MPSNWCSLKNVLRSSTALLGFVAAAALATTPAHAIVGNDAYPPASLVDTTNVTGVGQMIIDLGTGYIGLCTASLINPRTVIFASHCVNEEPANAYGAGSGGMPIGFGFQAYNRIPAINWLTSGYETSVSDAFYNSNYVVYNEHSLDLGPDWNFLQADVAIAALDTPAVDIPTWKLLFSPLTGPAHGTIIGYGSNGIGTTGYDDLDFRRRIAENTISLLGSLDDVDSFLFGVADGLPQNLYQLDFNDPKFNTAEANIYDFNIFHDAALQKEAITAPGDSGGPLVVDQLFNQQVIAAVLSGGSRYYYDQPSASYGTTSFYQPLYLFWDWIVENNPYKYVTAKAGDGLWTDPDHWEMALDPNYMTIVDGQLVNALPTDPAQGVPDIDQVNTPKFGDVCYYDDCVDIATGEFTSSGTGGAANIELGNLASSPALIALSEMIQSMNQAGATNSSALPAMRAFLEHTSTAIQPMSAPAQAAIIAGQAVSSLPGTSGFVPDDTDGDPATGDAPRYYDVTLSADGTTTLDAGIVIIDRLTINGARAGLTISEQAGMATLIDTTMYAGNFRVDGLFASVGDLMLMGGVLSGNGIVAAPYTTAVLGAIAPGTVGTTGTLTMLGDVVLSSGSGLLVDLAPEDNDLLDVYGVLSLGGTLVVTPVGGYVPKWHEQKTVAYGDEITGAFASIPDTIVGVLYPTAHTTTVDDGVITYQAEVVTFEAASFASQLTDPTQDQLVIGDALDRSRSMSYTQAAALYDSIDSLNGAALGSVLESLAPDTARVLPASIELLTDAHTSFVWQYLSGMHGGGEGQVAVQTSALKLTQNNFENSIQTRSLLANVSDWGAGMGAPVSPLPAASEGGMKLPKGMGAFLSGQAIDGTIEVGGGGGKADVDGYLIALGADYPVSTRVRLGLSVAFGEAKAKLAQGSARTDTNMKQAIAYGRYDDGDYFADGFFGVSTQAMHTERYVALGGLAYHLTGHTSGSGLAFGLQLGELFDVSGLKLAPAAGVQYARPDIAGYAETGGVPALNVSPFQKEELSSRIGLDAHWTIDVGSVVLTPDLHAFFVNKMAGTSAPTLAGAFVALPGSSMTFAVQGTTKQWAELGVGTRIDLGEGASMDLRYSANPGRHDASYSAWTGSLRINF